MSNPDLLARVAKALNQSFSPSGEEGVPETAKFQLENEKELESLFVDCKSNFGTANAVTVEIFLRLFDVLIGLYRLDRCEDLLKEMIPAIDRLEAKAVSGTASSSLTSKYKLKAIQCLAFTKWKQGKLQEALDLFIQMESMMKEPSPTLLENMGHTYSSLGDLEKAEKYFNRAIEAGGANKGGLLLGLGLVSERSGDLETGLEKCLEALRWYEGKFSHASNESSLEAKCCMSIAKIYQKLKNQEIALEFASRAVDNFRRTCGSDSPLLASALKVQGEILAAQSSTQGRALTVLHESFRIEATKDVVDMVGMMELIHVLTKVAQKIPEVNDRDAAFKSSFAAAEIACENIRKKLQPDGNVAAFLKFVAELGVYSNELKKAKQLLEEALPLFKNEKSIDCTGIIQQCEQIVALIDQKIAA